MPSYTTYFIDASGRVRLGGATEHADDQAAVAHFQQGERGPEAAELWQGGRLVARLRPPAMAQRPEA